MTNTNTVTEARSVVVERELPFPPEKIWRALTQPHLIEEWLMQNDFKPVVDHRFNFRADWGAVDCQVVAVEPGLVTLAVSTGMPASVAWRIGVSHTSPGIGTTTNPLTFFCVIPSNMAMASLVAEKPAGPTTSTDTRSARAASSAPCLMICVKSFKPCST